MFSKTELLEIKRRARDFLKKPPGAEAQVVLARLELNLARRWMR